MVAAHLAPNMATQTAYIRNETITPLIKLSIHFLPRTFFYLYPFPYSLAINEEGIVVFEKRPGFWKFLPYYLSLFVITGMLGIPMTIYVIFSYILDFRVSSTLHISLTEVMFSFAITTFGLAELLTMGIILCFPELLLEFKALRELERCCKRSTQINLSKRTIAISSSLVFAF